MARGAPITQEKIRARKIKRRFWISFAIFSVFVIIFCGASLVSSLSFFQVKNIEVLGVEGETAAAASEAAAANLSGETLWFFPHSDIFFVSAKSIASDVVSRSPEISSVTVSKKFFNTLVINIEMKNPVAVWCLDGACDVLDSSGMAFDATTTYATTTFVTFGNGKIPHIGASILPPSEFPSLMAFIYNLPQRGLETSSASISDGGEVHINIATSSALIVDPSKNLSQSLANLDLLLTNKTSGMTVDQINSLQYLDLRFPDKIFYK